MSGGRSDRLAVSWRHRAGAAVCALVAALAAGLLGAGDGGAHLAPADTVRGYVALLLVNETPFPGERAWTSEADTKSAMLAILHVLDNRVRHIPPGYRQEQVASERCKDIIGVITAGGEKGQCDGFYRDAGGRFVTVPRVRERVDYLVQCANRGEPGRFARLLEYAQGLADAYVNESLEAADRFAGLERVGGIRVTGRAYSWMTDQDCYSPGGDFVRIPDSDDGSLGGNRFFTLRKLQ